ncbi:MAG: HTH domain-containing protein [Anaerolineales bacterium]
MTKFTARQRILAYFESHPAVSPAELARALQMTPANARRHLGILLADGRIQSLGTRPQPGKAGRPQQLFGLSETRLGENFSALAAIALTEWLAPLTPAAREDAVRVLAEKILPVAENLSTWHITRRLAFLSEKLSALGYRARWEARAAGPRVVLAHCPYAAIVDGHPELCRMDAQILENHLGLEMTQRARREKNDAGLPVCVFSPTK